MLWATLRTMRVRTERWVGRVYREAQSTPGESASHIPMNVLIGPGGNHALANGSSRLMSSMFWIKSAREETS